MWSPRKWKPATMSDPQRVRGRRVSPLDRRMLAAAYWPVIALAIVLIGSRSSRCHRDHSKAAPK